MMDNKKRAFTLSEVLVTISLIGFLATMTLSTVGASVQQRARLAEFRTAYAKMSTTLKGINTDEGKIYSCYRTPQGTESDNYGLDITAGLSSTTSECEALLTAFTNALGATRKCDDPIDDGCISANYPKGESGCFTSYNGKAYVLDNSMIVITDGNNSLTRFAVDVNGRKGPNKWGQDIFPFSIMLTESTKIGSSGITVAKDVGIYPPAGDNTSCKYLKTNASGSKEYRASKTTTEMMEESSKGN